MKLFLAGLESLSPDLRKETKKLKYVLQSFYYVNPWEIPYIQNHWEQVLIDSGAFTFINSCKGNVNFNEYIDKYIKFINENDIKYFFELDIDSVVGYQEVLQIRKRIEQQTMKKCIPVWHKSRGKEEYKRMCQEYNYVAIGGLVTKEIKRAEYEYLNWFTDYAHSNDCIVHGLGFTGKNAVKYGFDSVDSTSWTSGRRFGSLYIFDGKDMKTHYKKAGYRMIPNDVSTKHNLQEWIKYQRYLDTLSAYDKATWR